MDSEENREDRLPVEYTPPNVQAALLEKQRDIVQVLYPRPDQVRQRILQVGRLGKGRKVTPAQLTKDRIVLEILAKMERGESWTLDDFDPVGTYLSLTSSEGGKGRAEGVEIARIGRPAEPRRGLVGRFFR